MPETGTRSDKGHKDAPSDKREKSFRFHRYTRFKFRPTDFPIPITDPMRPRDNERIFLRRHEPHLPFDRPIPRTRLYSFGSCPFLRFSLFDLLFFAVFCSHDFFLFSRTHPHLEFSLYTKPTDDRSKSKILGGKIPQRSEDDFPVQIHHDLAATKKYNRDRDVP